MCSIVLKQVEREMDGEIAGNFGFLEEQDFYEMCQVYRHSRDCVPNAPGHPTASQAFEELKDYIRQMYQTGEYVQRARTD